MQLLVFSPVWLVDDMSATINFYCKKLGFALIDRFEDHYAEVAREQVSIRLMKAQKTGARNSINFSDPNNFADAYILVENVYELYARCQEHAVQLDGEPQDSGYGMVDFIITDNNGYRLCFGEALEQIPEDITPVQGYR